MQEEKERKIENQSMTQKDQNKKKKKKIRLEIIAASAASGTSSFSVASNLQIVENNKTNIRTLDRREIETPDLFRGWCE